MAIRLAVIAYGFAVVVFAVEIWRFLILGCVVARFSIEGMLIGWAIALLFLLLGLLWFLFWAGAYSLLLNLLWSSPPKWLRLPKVSTLVNRDFGILISATLPLVVVLLAEVGLRVGLRYYFPTLSTFRMNYETFLLEYAWLWFVSAVFLYHGYYQVRARVMRKKRQRRAASA